MGGKYGEARVSHVRQGHENVLAARGVDPRLPQGVPVPEARLIPVMTVGNVQLPAGKVLSESLQRHRVVDDPQPVGHQAVGEFVPGRAGLGQVFQPLGSHMAFILIQGIDGAEVAPGGGQEPEPVLLGLAEGFLVGENHPVLEVLQAHQAYQAPDLPGLSLVHLGEKFLFIQVHALLEIRFQDPLLAPLGQGLGGGVVGIFPFLGQFQADDVVAVSGKVLPALCFADDIVGRAGELIDGSRLVQIVPQGLQRPNFCHVIPSSLGVSSPLLYGMGGGPVNREWEKDKRITSLSRNVHNRGLE